MGGWLEDEDESTGEGGGRGGGRARDGLVLLSVGQGILLYERVTWDNAKIGLDSGCFVMMASETEMYTKKSGLTRSGEPNTPPIPPSPPLVPRRDQSRPPRRRGQPTPGQ